MKIYTKTGDEGKTGLLGGQRVSKGCMQIDVIGAIDELNGGIGLLRATVDSDSRLDSMDAGLCQIQNVLFQVGAVVADNRKEPIQIQLERWTTILEQQIDHWETDLPSLTQFILPAGSLAASQAHFIRGICRRAERRLVQFLDQPRQPQEAPRVKSLQQSLTYLNRLSDYLFVMARSMNQKLGVNDEPWEGLDASKQ